MANLGALPIKILQNVALHLDENSQRSLSVTARNPWSALRPIRFRTIALNHWRMGLIEEEMKKKDETHRIDTSETRRLIIEVEPYWAMYVGKPWRPGHNPNDLYLKSISRVIQKAFPNVIEISVVGPKNKQNESGVDILTVLYAAILKRNKTKGTNMRPITRLSWIESKSYGPFLSGYTRPGPADLMAKPIPTGRLNFGLDDIIPGMSKMLRRLSQFNISFTAFHRSPSYWSPGSPTFLFEDQFVNLRKISISSGGYTTLDPAIACALPHVTSLYLRGFVFVCRSQLEWILTLKTLEELVLDTCPMVWMLLGSFPNPGLDIRTDDHRILPRMDGCIFELRWSWFFQRLISLKQLKNFKLSSPVHTDNVHSIPGSVRNNIPYTLLPSRYANHHDSGWTEGRCDDIKTLGIYWDCEPDEWFDMEDLSLEDVSAEDEVEMNIFWPNETSISDTDTEEDVDEYQDIYDHEMIVTRDQAEQRAREKLIGHKWPANDEDLFKTARTLFGQSRISDVQQVWCKPLRAVSYRLSEDDRFPMSKPRICADGMYIACYTVPESSPEAVRAIQQQPTYQILTRDDIAEFESGRLYFTTPYLRQLTQELKQGRRNQQIRKVRYGLTVAESNQDIESYAFLQDCLARRRFKAKYYKFWLGDVRRMVNTLVKRDIEEKRSRESKA